MSKLSWGHFASIGVGMGAIGGALSYSSAKAQQERQNAVLEARQAAVRQKREFDKGSFELTTFASYYEAEAAGTLRIARSIGMGARSTAGQAMQGLDTFRLDRDRWLGERQQKFAQKQAELQIQDYEKQKRDPSDVGWEAFGEAFMNMAIPFIPTVLEEATTTRVPVEVKDDSRGPASGGKGGVLRGFVKIRGN